MLTYRQMSDLRRQSQFRTQSRLKITAAIHQYKTQFKLLLTGAIEVLKNKFLQVKRIDIKELISIRETEIAFHLRDSGALMLTFK